MAAPAAKKGRVSLYENLLSDDARAEIKARDEAAAAEAAKKKSNASLMFKPSNLGKKPAHNAKAKPKPNFSAMHKNSSSTSIATPSDLPSSDGANASQQRRGFQDWLANDDEEAGYNDRPRWDRNGKKMKNKKKNKQAQQQQTWSYDDIYDPSKPTNYAHYIKSEAYFQAQEEWKQRLYDLNRKERKRLGLNAKERPAAKEFAPPVNSMFAPPPELSSYDDVRPQSAGSSPPRRTDSDRDYDDMPRVAYSKPSFAPPPSLAPPAVTLNKEETADEAYARRVALAEAGAQRSVAPSPTPAPAWAPAPTPAKTATPEELEKRARAAQQIAALKAKMAAKAAASKPSPSPTPEVKFAPQARQSFVPQSSLSEPEQSFTQKDLDDLQAEIKKPDIVDREYSPEITITRKLVGLSSSRGPLPPPEIVTAGMKADVSGGPTYNAGYPGIPPFMDRKVIEAAASAPSIDAAPTKEAPPSQEAPAADDTEEPSKRPGQTGFAERLLRKMGWEKGQGLGAANDGITTALTMKADKRNKRGPGGGSAQPAMGKIVGGKKNPVTESAADTPHGNMSEVIKLEGMLANLDVEHEIQENNLLQEIGDHMGDEFGKVERLFIWRAHAGGNEEVFVRFTSQLSALRAVKGMDGVEFAGNMVKGMFWPREKFEHEEYA